uniref:integrin alpha-D-like isoform X2 n=1 Tax=Ciona intestinalis TaxID=7719 RepID=UPI000EF4FA3C|nr:integrin alpha-D-like isoform X2 [Ciona intestinalis]|eukprot:XP_018671341.2 integrin alpha-D-like isoform X2 [Ciona intestinalis]
MKTRNVLPHTNIPCISPCSTENLETKFKMLQVYICLLCIPLAYGYNVESREIYSLLTEPSTPARAKRDVETSSAYFGYSLALTQSGSPRILIGAPSLKSTAALNNTNGPAGGMYLCPTTPQANCTNVTPTTPPLQGNDAFGLDVNADPTGNVIGCSPLRPTVCESSVHKLGYCYSGTNYGQSWSDKSFLGGDVCPPTHVDVLFVLDSSGSIMARDFALLQEWTINITRSLDIGPNGTVSVGLMQFADPQRISLEFEIGTFNTKDEIVAAIHNNTHLKGKTFTADALNQSVPVFKKSPRFNDTLTKKVLIFFTDGIATDAADVPYSAQFVRDAGIIPIAVGVTQSILPSRVPRAIRQLQTIATGEVGNTERSYVIGKTADLGTIVDEIFQTISGIVLEVSATSGASAPGNN